MRLIRASECRVMPWKNGGGTTTEIAVHPPGASLDAFDWRISTAHVGMDGPFSSFPGIDRTLSVLAGNGIALHFSDGETTSLFRDSAPYAFAADRDVEGRLLDGPIDDLNVMTRRGRWRHDVTPIAGPGPIEVSLRGRLLVVIACSTGWSVATEAQRANLEMGDSVLLEHAEEAVLTGNDGGGLFLIELWSDASR
jgi:environmental stress-induced protein Ves